jgi:hypothetical protein
VITGIVRRRVAVGSCRYPGIGAVTLIALHGCNEMAGRFSGGTGAVMAGGAGAGGTCVIIAGRNPCRCSVTVVTYVAARYVCRSFSGGCRTVMAAVTGAGNGEVIHVRRHPAIGRVTVITGVGAGYVGG